MRTITTKNPYLDNLNTRGNIYEEFLPDQVLTHNNLNKIVNYFEDQDRLSRIHLIGVGIGCGLNIVSYSNKHIEIGQGVGITTDGDIIQTATRDFQYYSAFADKANYSLFADQTGDAKVSQMKVYELHEQEATGRLTDELPLASFSTNESTSLKDCIVIAYVESYTEDEGLCGGSGCDETGNKVFHNVKFLLTHKSNYKALTAADTIYKSHDVLAYYDTLPDICLPRIILKKNNTRAGISIINQYTNAFTVKDELFLGMSTIIQSFSNRINFKKFGVHIEDIGSYFTTIFTTDVEMYVQYKYDLLKDLIETYREIKKHILHCKFECVPNIKAFPKHLLLGTPDETTRHQTRHYFYPSPMVSEGDENLIAIKTLCIRFYNQLKGFKINEASSAQIKITPSKNYTHKLSDRSIPYYYRTTAALVNHWNPVSNSNRKATSQLGYHTGNLLQKDCILKPLEFNHADKDFYRIEGHQGKNFVTALKGIQTLQRNYNLPFDVKAISIGYPVNKISLEDDTCDTKEYKILMQTWQRDFECVANKAIAFFEKYQYTNPGSNTTAVDLYTVYEVTAAEKEEVLGVPISDGTKDDTQADPVKEVVTIKDGIASDEVKEVQVAARVSDEQAQQLTKEAEKNDQVAALVDKNLKGYAIYAKRESLNYAMNSILSQVNIENLTVEYVIGQAERVFDRIQGFDRNSEAYKLYVEIPLRIITQLEIVKYRFITTLKDVYVTERWTAFHNVFSELCTEIESIIFTLSNATENGSFGSRVHDNMYEYLVHEIAQLCCIKGKFNWLKTQLDEIRKDLYKELILSNLLEQHPGIEHMAGVPKGGTFLLVYIGEKQETMEGSDAVIETFDRTVLFDFAVPYMCTSICPPKTIVYSDVVDPVTLAIARKKFCLPSQSEQEDFIIAPERGVVTSPDGTAFIITTAKGYAFDPTKVPDELLGESITFLVDGKIPTIPLEIEVYRLPEDVNASYELVAWTADGLVINLTVTHELEDLLYLSHTWKRANGTVISEGKNPTNILLISDENNFTETFTLTIDVIGNPVPCKLTIDVEINEERPVIEVDVNIANEICYNTIESTPEPIPITVTPENGTLTSPEQTANGQTFIELSGGQYQLNPFFVPFSLVGEPITFEVNSNPVADVTTRVYKLPAVVETEHEIISWDDAGVFVNIFASHTYESKSYLAYEWLNENNEVVGNTLNLLNFRIEEAGEAVNRTFTLRMQVMGTDNEMCMTDGFQETIEAARPQITVSVPPAICWKEESPVEPIAVIVSDDGVELTCPQQDAFGITLLEGEPGNYTFNIESLPNELVGVPINFNIEDEVVATTIVYKVPTTVEAFYDNATWNGNTLQINLRATHSLSDIEKANEYLEFVWRNNDEELIGTSQQIFNHSIETEEGNATTTYTLLVRVHGELIQDACQAEEVTVEIEEARPEITVEIAPEFCDIGENVEQPESFPITVNPSNFAISSPQGNEFIIGSPGIYRFIPNNVPEELLGQTIEIVADGNVEATTKVFRIPELNRVNISVTNKTWRAEGLAVDLSHGILERSYYNMTWMMSKDGAEAVLNQIEAPNTFLIPDEGNGVNVEVFLRISTSESDISCTQETLRTSVNETRSISVSRSTFCQPDTPVAFRGITPETGTLTSANQGMPNDAITISENRYIFDPNRVPNSLLGERLRFRVDGITQSTVSIFVYKMPKEDSVVQDVQASSWMPGGYRFVLTHELIDKNYFGYELKRSSNGELIEQIDQNTFFIATNEDVLVDEIIVKIYAEGVDCTATKNININVTQSDNPEAKLNCATPYDDRMKLLEVSQFITSLRTSYKSEDFASAINDSIFIPLENVLNSIRNARDLDSVIVSAISSINQLRNKLEASFINKPEIKAEFILSFYRLDEIMELMVLEMLRCATKKSDTLFSNTNTFFTVTNKVNEYYAEKQTMRRKIDDNYLQGFNPVIVEFKSQVSNAFPTAKP